MQNNTEPCSLEQIHDSRRLGSPSMWVATLVAAVAASLFTAGYSPRAFAQGTDSTCPYSALRQDGVQQYQRMYAAAVLKELPRANLRFPPDQQTVTAKELLQPIHSYMMRAGWPAAITDAVLQIMANPDNGFAACFPDVAKLKEPLQSRLEQSKAKQSSSALAVEGTPHCEINRSYTRLASHQEVVAILEGPRMQAIARSIAERLARDLGTVNPLDANLDRQRLANIFRERLHIAASEVSRDLTPALGWTGGNVPQSELASCFPAFAALSQVVESRLEEARQKAAKEVESNNAEARMPVNILATAYAAYVDVKRCYDARSDYNLGYITSSEMQEARRAVKQVEVAVKPRLDASMTAENIWARVEDTEGKRFFPSRDFSQEQRYQCRERLGILLKVLREQVPSSSRIEKDF